ncbi:MAG: DUF547 domain-containing protein [Chlorobiota bacterium]|jgi:hypothetical protein|nr:DUF547 domain-containing protein [Chlorobiota bacterium]QQS66129.1 MAG: DUF547 domain-containing protein [Chlorobiota bacterium]
MNKFTFNFITFFISTSILIAGNGIYDHSAFNKLLSKTVSNGKIKYSVFKSDTNFTNYLTSLEKAKPEDLSKNEQLAFWINAYNACVIKNVLDNFGIKKPTDVKGFFDVKKFKIANKNLTLNEIENDIVRAKFKEPLVHFGLVCGAVSCPPIVNKVYTGKTVMAMLSTNAKNYLASSQNKLDEAKKTIYLSKIFEWYSKDFSDKKGEIEFLKKYGTKGMQDFIKVNTDVIIDYMEYNWSLNGK